MEEKKTEYLYYCDFSEKDLMQLLPNGEKGCLIREQDKDHIVKGIQEAHSKVGQWKTKDEVPLTARTFSNNAAFSKIQGQGKLDTKTFVFQEWRKIGEKGDWVCYGKFEGAAMLEPKITFPDMPNEHVPDNNGNQPIDVHFKVLAKDCTIHVADVDKDSKVSLCAVKLAQDSK